MKYLKKFKLYECNFSQVAADLSLKRLEIEYSKIENGDLDTIGDLYIKEKDKKIKLPWDCPTDIKQFAIRLGYSEDYIIDKTEDEISELTYGIPGSLKVDDERDKKEHELWRKISVICKWEEELVDLYHEFARAMFKEDYLKCRDIKKQIEDFDMDEDFDIGEIFNSEE